MRGLMGAQSEVTAPVVMVPTVSPITSNVVELLKRIWD